VSDRSGPRRKIASQRPPRAIDDPKTFSSAVGESIRRERQARGWTQVQLAKAAGLSPNYVARLERGELGPSLFVANQICDALEIDVDTLLRPESTAVHRSGRRRVSA
jgi:transcriptional regulator with XRE-family HTH domain